MKITPTTTRRTGLALAGLLACALTAYATKPVPPPDDPPPAAYDQILLGDPGTASIAWGINESGLVIAGAYGHLALVVPELDNGTLVWRRDADLDGRNDLLRDLGDPEMAQIAIPQDINDDGVILISGTCTDPQGDWAWILAPEVVNGQLSWSDLDSEGVNRQIAPLPVLATPIMTGDMVPGGINNHGEVPVWVRTWVRTIDNGVMDFWAGGFLLVPSYYDVSPEGAVVVDYPAADLDGDGLNDHLIDLGMGISHLDEEEKPLLPAVINDRGDVAGTVARGGYLMSNGRPFVIRPLQDEDGALIWNDDQDGDGVNDLALYLPLPPDKDSAEITDMNENGTVVGTVLLNGIDPRAAIWQVDWEAGTASVTVLGPLERKYDKSHAEAVNAVGQMVGWSTKTDRSGSEDKAWLWDQGTMVSIGGLVPPETGLADPSHRVFDINDSGMIVGYQKPEGQTNTAFILIPATGQ